MLSPHDCTHHIIEKHMLSASESYYEATVNRPAPFPSLSDSQTFDVCVVGGGYTGVSSALHLAQQGFTVALLEAERIGFGASGRNGGHVDAGPVSYTHLTLPTNREV